MTQVTKVTIRREQTRGYTPQKIYVKDHTQRKSGQVRVARGPFRSSKQPASFPIPQTDLGRHDRADCCSESCLPRLQPASARMQFVAEALVDDRHVASLAPWLAPVPDCSRMRSFASRRSRRSTHPAPLGTPGPSSLLYSPAWPRGFRTAPGGHTRAPLQGTLG